MKILFLLSLLLGCTDTNFDDKKSDSNAKNGEQSDEFTNQNGSRKTKDFTITPPIESNIANFCLGLNNALETTNQDVAAEIGMFCTDGQPSDLVQGLLSNLYQGAGDFRFGDQGSGEYGVVLLDQEDENNLQSSYHVAYAMKFNKSPTVVLEMEEKNIIVPYDGGNLKINSVFMPTPVNQGDSYTAFNVQQRTVVDDNVSFDDTSVYDLKMYKLHKYNIDMFLSARTLANPSEHFKSSKVLRGSFADPKDANVTYSIGILKYEMNSREEHNRMIDTFSEFVIADLLSLYDMVSQGGNR